MMIDTHTHLYSDAFQDDRPKVIARAQEAGIKKFVIPAIDSSYHRAMYDLEKRYPGMFLMMGLHPTSVKPESFEKELQLVRAELKQRKFYAVGEIGIDLYWEKETLELQKKVFKTQIQMAKKHKLPIVIHCRDAFDEVFEVLETEKDDRLFGVFHCFTGDYEQAQKALSYNMKLGIGGVVTFKNGKIDTFLNKIPLEQIVLETDSPYLTPVPYRGKRNESAYLDLICKKVSELYEVPEDEVARITTENSVAIFGI